MQHAHENRRAHEMSSRTNRRQARAVVEACEPRLLFSYTYDGDDTLGTATAASVPGTYYGSIDDGHDVDIRKVTLSAFQTIGIDIDARSGMGQPYSYLRVFNGLGVELGADNFGSAPDESYSGLAGSYLEFMAIDAGTYYIGVSHDSGTKSYDPRHLSQTGNLGEYFGYKLILTDLTPIPQPPNPDPDDQISEAVTLSAFGTYGPFDLTPATDVDMFRMNLYSGQRIAIDIDRIRTNTLPDNILNGAIAVFSGTGTKITSSFVGAAPNEVDAGEGYLSHANEGFLEFTAASSGWYYVGISSRGNHLYDAVYGTNDQSGDSTGGFTLTVTDLTSSPNLLSAVQQPLAEPGDNGIQLWWADVNNPQANGHIVERSVNGSHFYEIARVGLSPDSSSNPDAPVSGYHDTDVSVGSTYVYRLRAYTWGGIGPDGVKSSPVSVSHVLPNVLRVNAAGAAFTDGSGNAWQSEVGFTGGSTSSGAYDVLGTTNDPLYFTRRFGSNFSFSRPVVNGNYTLRLHLAEPFHTATGKRRFDVTAEGVKVLSGYDIVADVGAKRAVVKSANVAVSDGKLDLQFNALLDNAIISAVELVPGTTTTPGGSIAGTVFNDLDKDGIIDSGEPRVSGRTIYIDANKNGQRDSGEKTAITNSSGVYTFSGLAASTYQIRRADLPSGYTFSTPSGGYHAVTLTSGQNVTGRNFGSIPITTTTTGGSISGTVFNDLDKDGVIDSGEPRVSGRTIYIDANKNGQRDSGEKTAITNSSGVYTFSGLAASTYQIRRADLPSGYTFSTPSGGYHTVTLTSGQKVGGRNFGSIPLTTSTTGGKITGTVFSDADRDGVLDSSDTRLANRRIYIDANNNGKYDSGEKNTYSNSSGVYALTGLSAGTYRVRRADLPTGYKYTTPSIGYHTVILGTNQTISGRNFGAVPV